MATLIDMPKLSDTMTVGTLVKWLKNEGDPVESGDMIAEVETDKATMEVECFEDGVLIKQYAAQATKSRSAARSQRSAKPAKKRRQSTPLPLRHRRRQLLLSPHPLPQLPHRHAPAASPAPAVAAPAPSGSRIKASPVAKKIAAEKGIDLSTIQGSGPGGRIVKDDVLNAQPGAAAPAASGGAPAAPAATLEALDIPVSNMRKSIAKALVSSKTQAPHFYLQMEVDGAPLAKLRAVLNAKLADLPKEHGGSKFTVNDLTLKAAAEAVRRVPAINRSWEGETIKQHANVHLAFGVAIDDGLVTPVIRAAETKGLREIGAEAKVLIKKARDKKLTPDEMSGSTLTVTNLGMFGVSDFYGIINPNNACILSIGATIKKPVVKGDEIVIGQTMKIGLSGDHRTIDGAVGAQYLQALKEILETPALMLV